MVVIEDRTGKIVGVGGETKPQGPGVLRGLVVRIKRIDERIDGWANVANTIDVTVTLILMEFKGKVVK